jgi:tetrapyrrole methylase family protein/MazG family protein
MAATALPRVVVVGLGPAGVDHLLPAARAALSGAGRRFVRTSRHPAVDELAAAGISLESFDDRYDRAGDLDAVYQDIVATLVAAATRSGDVVYAVPGNPVVAERSVELLFDRALRGDIDLTVIAGLSFTDLAWARLGIDPMGREARVVDGRAVDGFDLAGPMLIAQCDAPLVLSDVKLTLLEHLPPDTPVTVLARLGAADESVRRVRLAELDRAVEPDHLTTLFVDAGAGDAGHELRRLVALAARLRAPGGCPWDAEQTHHSLTRYVIEEAYEVVEALERLPAAPGGAPVGSEAYASLADELGDLLYQVVFHALIAEEEGAFTLADVVRGIHDKLVRRHPHVFAGLEIDGVDTLRTTWEQQKKDEKGASSILEGITPGLPSLVYAHKLVSKAASLGIELMSRGDAVERLEAGADSYRRDTDGPQDLVGELLAAVVVLARDGDLDAESALRGWAARRRAELEAAERAGAGD